MKAVLLVCLILVVSAYAAVKAPGREFRKQLQGPPSDFAVLAIPSPEKAALRADSSMIPFTLAPSRNGEEWTWSSGYPIDTADRISVSVLSPSFSSLVFYLKPPSATEFQRIDESMFTGADSIGKKSSGAFGIDGNEVPAFSYTFFNPVIGEWNIIINSTEAPIEGPSPGLPTGYLIIDNASPLKLVSHLNDYELEQGREIGVTIRMVNEDDSDLSDSELGTPLAASITSAEMSVILPSGNLVTVPMHDDGLHGDGAAADGIYSAAIGALSAGTYVFQPNIEGISPYGSRKYRRSTSHLVTVNSPEITLTGIASTVFDTETLSFYIDVDVLSAETDTVRAYAEIWGSDPKKLNYIPIAWAQSMVDTEIHETLGHVIRLDIDASWVKKAGASPPYLLRKVVVQDRNSNGLLSSRDEIFVETDSTAENHGRMLSKLYSLPGNVETFQAMEITERMKVGPRPAQYVVNDTLRATQATLLLVHGYCSGDVWPVADFTNAAKFEDYSKSRSHDEFALMIRAFGDPFGAFTIVGHSQGGLASLQLKTQYWSGLDLVENTGPTRRLIQSVGSPYKGCSLAGGLADVGAVFGVGCASNFDLSTDGASLWIAKIPKEPQDEIYYYTTKYDDSWWLYSACVTASGLVMYSPNDGTCEIKFSTLPLGGTSMGTKVGWCHTSGMNFPAQTTDKSRNSEINTNAAR